MVNTIVTVDVSQTVAPTPPTLQSCGAIISQGGTSLAANGISLLTQEADLAAILRGALAVTSITQTAGTATMTTTAPHGITSGQVVDLTIAGATPSAYNGTHACTSTGASTLTFTVPGGTATPATGTITYTPEDVAELTNTVSSFFAQGTGQAVWVLELGIGDAADGVAALDAYITANPNSDYVPGAVGYFYSYLVPPSWADESDFYDEMVPDFRANTAKTYFFITVTESNYTNFSSSLDKCVFALIESPDAGATDVSIAAVFQASLSFRPSPTNKVPPFAFTFLFGPTPYPTKGNAALLATLKTAHVNYVGTGAEGGISQAILLWGTTMDGRPFTYWYSVDAVQIYSDVNISNAVINGSNNPANPLYYNQDGIDRLEVVEVNTLNSLVSWGLANGQVVSTSYTSSELSAAIARGEFNGKLFVNCIPFIDYARANPGDYAIGEYDGMTVGYVAQNGFIHILVTINVTDFIAQ